MMPSRGLKQEYNFKASCCRIKRDETETMLIPRSLSQHPGPRSPAHHA